MIVCTDKKGEILLKQVYANLGFETAEGNRLYVCMRDNTYEINIMPNGETDSHWHRIDMENIRVIPHDNMLHGEELTYDKGFTDGRNSILHPPESEVERSESQLAMTYGDWLKEMSKKELASSFITCAEAIEKEEGIFRAVDPILYPWYRDNLARRLRVAAEFLKV